MQELDQVWMTTFRCEHCGHSQTIPENDAFKLRIEHERCGYKDGVLWEYSQDALDAVKSDLKHSQGGWTL